MKTIIILSFIALAIAAPPSAQKSYADEEILEQYNEPAIENVEYKFGFKTSGGYERDEKSTYYGGNDWGVTGSYKYYDIEGNYVETDFVAGVNGFVPTGTKILKAISDTAKAAADLPPL